MGHAAEVATWFRQAVQSTTCLNPGHSTVECVENRTWPQPSSNLNGRLSKTENVDTTLTREGETTQLFTWKPKLGTKPREPTNSKHDHYQKEVEYETRRQQPPALPLRQPAVIEATTVCISFALSLSLRTITRKKNDHTTLHCVCPSYLYIHIYLSGYLQIWRQ